MKNIIYAIVVVCCAFFLDSCTPKSKNVESIDPDDTTTLGRKVEEMNADGTPKLLHFYKVDDQGRITDELIREVAYFPGKKKFIAGDIKNGKRNGHWFAYFENGKVNTEATYIEGKPDGVYTVYYDNGQIRYQGHYNKGICDGEWRFYTVDGKLDKTLVANDKTVICGSCNRCQKISNRISF